MTSSPPSSHLTVAVSAECPASPDGNYGEGLRSLWHLSRHLTARADDNHAAPSQRPRRASLSLNPSSAIQARVRFLAYHRIKPHVPPLVRAPVNSFEFHRCRRTPQVGCLTLSLGHSPRWANSGHPSFTVRTTRVSNPVRYPHFRASASVALPSAAFESESFVISKHFTATPRIPPTSRVLKWTSSRRTSAVERRNFTTRLTHGLRSL